MPTQKVQVPIVPISNKILDELKIKEILTKKISKISNPQQILGQLNDQFLFNLQKTQQQLSRQFQRQQKIKKVQEQQLKRRDILRQKIAQKISKTAIKRDASQKQKVSGQTKARIIKQQIVAAKLKQLKDSQFRHRIEQFKAYQSLNKKLNSKQIQQDEKPILQKMPSKLYLSSNDLDEIVQKSKALQETEYQKKLQKLQKKRLFQKSDRIFRFRASLDKSEQYSKIKNQDQNKLIQQVGSTEIKIQNARKLKQQQKKKKVQGMIKQAEIDAEQRQYKLEELKQLAINKLKTKQQLLIKKNQQYVTFRNKSTPFLMKSQSLLSDNISENNSMMKTNVNFRKSLSLLKASQYLQSLVRNKLKNQVRKTIVQVLKDEKRQILIK